MSRPNRFIANVMVDGRTEVCHVKNTGRCKELLTEGATVYVQHWNKPERRTDYDLIAVEKGERLINMDAQAPNKAFGEFLSENGLFSDTTLVRPETKYGSSRFDFYVEHGDKRAFIEVKGVTLEDDGVVRFPDAPTERGVKHIQELIKCKHEGYEAFIVFVIQMEHVKYMEPNRVTHEAFGLALAEAKANGVGVLAYDCTVTPSTMSIGRPVAVRI